MPIFLPVTTTAKGHPLEVWGCVRPAHYAAHGTPRRQQVQIQFRPSSGGRFKTVRRCAVTDRYGYFDVLPEFPGSGTVRLALVAIRTARRSSAGPSTWCFISPTRG